MRITKIIKNRGGFTMIEAMVTSLIFASIMAGLYSASFAGDRNFRVNKAQSEVQQEVRKAVEWMRLELQQAGPSSVINIPPNDLWYSSISFKIPDTVSNSGVIVWETDITEFVLGGSGNTELHRNKGGSTKIVALDIKSLQFRRTSAASDVIEVAMTAEKNTYAGDVLSHDVEFRVLMRNQ